MPIAVTGKVVNWIDSKATFGDERMHRSALLVSPGLSCVLDRDLSGLHTVDL